MNALAIATVTAVLKNLLDNLVVDDSLVATGTTPVKVSVGPPDFVKANGDADRPTQLNLYLYHVAPNQGWRNVGLPSRSGQGNRLANPPLAASTSITSCTVYGAQDFEQKSSSASRHAGLPREPGHPPRLDPQDDHTRARQSAPRDRDGPASAAEPPLGVDARRPDRADPDHHAADGHRGDVEALPGRPSRRTIGRRSPTSPRSS